jgi:uncharacterized repeat protein (TIGR03803 family)
MKMLTVEEDTPGKGRRANFAAAFVRFVFFLCAMLLPCFSSRALTTLYSFTNGFDGSQPYAGLAFGNDGDFYGTCFDGGSNGFGSIYRISPSGALTTLHSFDYGDGENPTAGLTLGFDGNFYGTTFGGGTNLLYGTVFQISTNGAFNALYSFTNGSDGANPYGGLVQAGNGNFYGTTLEGGPGNYGTIFQIASTGALNPLYSFTNGVDGSQPRATLTLGGGGTLFGTTYAGGSHGQGAVFFITISGALTALHSFDGPSDGANPVGQLIRANGLFYGTTSAGGTNGGGTVYQITSGGAFNVLYSFTGGSDGANPAAGLALGSDGNFYGTTYAGGPSGDGGIFKITPQGTLTPLYLFTGGDDGSASFAELVQGINGDFYGTTQYGGSSGDGVVFKINPVSTSILLTSITLSAGAIEFTWSGPTGQSYQAQYATNLTQSVWSNLGSPVTATNGVGSQTDSETGDAQRFYRVFLIP